MKVKKSIRKKAISIKKLFLVAFIALFLCSCANLKCIEQKQKVKEKQENKVDEVSPEEQQNMFNIAEQVITNSKIAKTFTLDDENTILFLWALRKAEYNLKNNKDLTYKDISINTKRFRNVLSKSEKPYLYGSVTHIFKIFEIERNAVETKISKRDRIFYLIILTVLRKHINKAIQYKSI